MPTYGERHDGQVAHISQYRDLFWNHAGYTGSGEEISEYLTNYAGEHHDIYQRLCFDLGIEAKPELFHPDPYGETP